ncbi:unnamed protein product [Callosobruchus maculatus]|uniref:Uncharacterized protein n=1 Tax=Callosobruchus maculatus TaxID=64391 RepID=A0A653D6H1_CALMS|nr:unnamed protein product [Callosobruchus maculatus]
MSNLVNYKHELAISKKTFKAKAQKSSSSFCSSLTAQTRTSVIWKSVNAVSREINLSIRNNISSEEAGIFVKKMAPDSVDLPLTLDESRSNNFLLKKIDLEEFNGIVKSETDPGIDGIEQFLDGYSTAKRLMLFVNIVLILNYLFI